MELPEVTFFDDFYFWFNTETKKEYYATPLYFYKADYHLDTENKLRDVYYKETETTDNGLKHPASIYFPFYEKLGFNDLFKQIHNRKANPNFVFKQINEPTDQLSLNFDEAQNG